jgi:hypothetical protein
MHTCLSNPKVNLSMVAMSAHMRLNGFLHCSSPCMYEGSGMSSYEYVCVGWIFGERHLSVTLILRIRSTPSFELIAVTNA